MCVIVREVCQVIWETLVGNYMPVPQEADWREIVVVIQAPVHLGSLFYNYKGSFLIVLLVAVDALYRWT